MESGKAAPPQPRSLETPAREPTIAPTTEPADPLGDLLALHRGRPLERRDRLTRLWPGLLLTLTLLSIGLWQGYYGYTRYGLVAGERWSRPWFLAAGMALALVVVWGLIRRRRTRWLVALHQKGIRYRLAGRKGVLRWSAIAGLGTRTTREHLFGITLSTCNQLIIFPNVGSPLRLDDRIQDLPSLTQALKAQFYPYLAPLLKQELQGGHWLYFGPLAMHKQGLRLGKQVIPWDQIQQVEVLNGRLVITTTTGRPRRLRASDITNLELLLTLINEVPGVETAGK